jgi:hypothetical protein
VPLRVIFAAFLIATVGYGTLRSSRAPRPETRDPSESACLSMPRPHSLPPGGPQANELSTPDSR